jgi:hypothetical protein
MGRDWSQCTFLLRIQTYLDANIDIAELQKFQLNEDSLQKDQLLEPPTPPDTAAAAQKIDFLLFAEYSAK